MTGPEISKLNKLDTPSKKIQCLVDVGKAINSCVQSFWGDRLPADKLTLLIIFNAIFFTMYSAADEFLPLFAYVTIKSNLNHPYTGATPLLC